MAICLAARAGAASGGIINLNPVKDGWVKIYSDDMVIKHKEVEAEPKTEDDANALPNLQVLSWDHP